MTSPHDQDRRDGLTVPATSGAMLDEAYDQLRRIAGDYLRRERVDHTLQPTALVHEAFLKIADRSEWNDATHFRAVAARAMRQILIDHARHRGREKRGGDRQRVMLTATVALEMPRPFDVIALDEALNELEQEDARKARVVEMRFFGGLSAKETAAVLGIAAKTAEADWYFARAWLHERLFSS